MTGLQPEKKESRSPGRTPVPAGLVMILFLAGGLVLSILNPGIVAVAGHGNPVSGEWASGYQARYEQDLPIRTPAIRIWGLLRYLAFREGAPGVLVGRNGWLFTEEEFVRSDGDAARARRNLEFMSSVRDRLRDKGIELVVALVPAKARIYPEKLGRYSMPEQIRDRYREYRDALLDLEIPAPDLEAALRDARPGGRLFLRTDTHWTPLGARTAAEALVSAVSPVLEQTDSPRREFTARKINAALREGDLLGFLPLGPFRDWIGPEPDRVDRYIIEEKDAPQIGLFDEVPHPVTLIGTSYSAGSAWSFDGFLKVELQAEVLNLAEQGRGPFLPMLEYLESRTIQEVPPDLVIWEVPERYLAVEYELEAGRR